MSDRAAKQGEQIPHLLEILKIIEGAVNADLEKVTAYARQLALKIQNDGQISIAERINKILTGAKTRELRTSGGVGSSGMPVDTESRFPLADEYKLLPEDVAIILPKNALQTVNEFLRFVRESDRLLAHGVGISPSLLLYGPPGCGKTELGKFIAAQLELPLVIARTDSLISSFLGSTAKNLRTLFEHAMARPCVLFLDEFDAVGKLRDDAHELGELKRVVISLLQNIDSLDKQTVLLAATNHEHLLDPAIWRRFAFKIRLDLPDFESRLGLFNYFLSDFSEERDIQLFAAAGQSLTGADIKQISEDAKRSAILSGAEKVAAIDVLRRILGFNDKLAKSVSAAEELRILRNIAPSIFSYRRLAELFGVSLGHVSNLIRDQGKSYGRRPEEITNKSGSD
jgi:ATP-dependent Zn protease